MATISILKNIEHGAAAGALALLLAAAASPGAAAPESEAKGPEALYRSYCSVCHGDRGDGRSGARASLSPPPRDFTDPRSRGTLGREAMIAVTREGKSGTAMVGWKTQLSDAQIAAIVDYIRITFMRLPGEASATPAPSAIGTSAGTDMSLPLPKGLKGDATRGGRFYRANCVACHGVNGDGRGPRAYFINPKPRNFRSSEARALLNRPALFSAISMGRNGTEMPAWSKVLSDQQLADLAEYVFREYVRGGPARDR